MKLLQILYPGLGGHSSVAFSLIEAADHHFEHSLLGFGIEVPSDMFVEKAKEMNVPFETVKKNRGFDFASQKIIYQLLKKNKPERLILHSTSLILVVYIYSLFHKVKWLCVEHQSNYAKTNMEWVYTFFILLLSPKIVYLTDDYKKEIKLKFRWFANEKKIRVIPNGINTKKFHPVERNEKNDEFVFSMISRLTALRDHTTLIRAVAHISRSFQCKLYIAGDGGTKPELIKMVNDLFLTDVVIFTGTLTENGVIDLLHKTDIYVHSSLAETLSTSILQVMACKVPIIATDIAGINTLLIHRRNALLFPVRDVEQLINYANELKCNPELVTAMVNENLKKIDLYYSSTSMFKSYLEIFVELK